jgi:hypothetical protein
MTDFRIKVYGLLGGVLPWSWSRLMTGSVSEAALAATLDSATNTLWTTATNGIQSLTTANVTLVGTQVSTLNATLHEVTKTVTARALAGTASGSELPWECAVVVGFTGPQITKTDRGRVRFPTFAASTLSAGLLSAGTVASLKTVLDVYWPALRSGGSTYFSANRLVTVGGQAPFTKSSLTNYHISNKLGSMQRRDDKRVPNFTQSAL